MGKPQLEPDFICFQWFAFTQLQWLYEQYQGAIERVDFWVERNRPISQRMQNFHGQLDMLGWHARNARRGKLDRSGAQRYWEMTEGGFGTRKGRYGHRGEMSKQNMLDLAQRFAIRIAEDKARKPATA